MFGWGQGNLYKQVYADDALTEAWRKVRLGTDLAGVDGVTIAQFQARLFANLKALQNDLYRQRYSPQPVKRLAIPKPDGTRRPLGILTVRDRIVQRAVLLVIDPLFEADFEECSHGFRKGRSVHTALTQVVRCINLGYGWIVDFDIASCFDMINTKRLFKFIKERLTNDELRRLMQAWLELEAATVERPGLRRQREARGILQGGILSPLFANIYLDRFDKAALKYGLKLVRYADDGLVCCRSQQEATATLKVIQKLLAKLDLVINLRKTVIQHVEKGFDYLGERFFIKYRGNGEEAVVVRPVKPASTQATIPPQRRLQPPPVAHQDSRDEDVWEHST
jgi:group II intron reverse transcriptase/maturase